MRVAVAGATGNIGTRAVAALERAGHEVVRISRSLGVDLITGDGLEAALTGVDAVVDATSYETADRDDAVAYFGTTTRNLLTAEERAGVRHHVLLSIVGVDRIGGNAHYAGKREQERLVTEGLVPWTIVRVTQFYDFAAKVTNWTTRHGRLAERPEARADLVREQLRLFPGREVAALAGLVVVDEVGICPLCPAPRGLEDLVREGGHRPSVAPVEDPGLCTGRDQSFRSAPFWLSRMSGIGCGPGS